jgi:hypothetical protein
MEGHAERKGKERSEVEKGHGRRKETERFGTEVEKELRMKDRDSEGDIF